VQGTIIVKNADQTALTTQKDTIANTLTTHVQSASPSNAKSQVTVDTITKKDNGDLEMAYTCSGVGDHTSCQDSLHTAAQSDAIKQTVGKCSQSDDQHLQTTQKPKAAAEAPATTPSTNKVEDKKPNQASQAPANTGKTASIASHTCSSTDSKTVQGTIIVKNCDKTALTTQKDTIANTLTSHVQSASPSNAKSQVTVDTITKKDNGDLEMAYTCSGVSDHTSCQNSLHTAAQSDAIKQTVGKCSQSDDHEGKASQKPEPASTASKKDAATVHAEAPTTHKGEDLTLITVKKIAETATAGKKLTAIDLQKV
jgi:hypothetical protein